MSQPNITLEPKLPKPRTSGPWWADPALRAGGLTAKAEALFGTGQEAAVSTFLSAKDVVKRRKEHA